MKEYKITLVTEPVSEMKRNSIYIDGAVRGCIIDVENNSYSFDHHVEPRFSQSSAAFQVTVAILQGLDLTPIKNIVVSSIDADSVLSTAILRNPEWVRDLKFVHLIQDLSRIDNHGLPAVVPDEPIAGYHFALRPQRGQEETTDLLLTLVEKAEEMYNNGELFAPGEIKKFPGVAFALDKNCMIIHKTMGEVSFDDIYEYSGFGILVGEKGKVTIGKKPFFPIKSLSGLWEYLSGFEDPPGKWGGADSIGGSPMLSGSSQTHYEILDRLEKYIK